MIDGSALCWVSSLNAAYDLAMWQKPDYIHRNPVKPRFVNLPEHWRWSSARSYAGEQGPIEVDLDW